ncbi:lipoprotein [Spiroplasma alleghenense]|uniref:Lipoprotein n=1 Tax=Spiroplasma alleghenense TaxID=216931 RepID=A0A345Z2U8_9MOLU|nr:lipoprotein [Spiroplasma alleghenense]AXK50927.1 hypothetical protein SALLE_v1c02510 [Spiroplasma alleghenense]
MKKLLSVLAALGLVTTSTTGVVSCFETPVKKMDLNTENLDAWVKEQKFEYIGEFYFFDGVEGESKEWLWLDSRIAEKIKNVISEMMLKSFEYPQNEVLNIKVSVDYDDLIEKINSEKPFKSGQKYIFKFDLKIKNIIDGKIYEYKDIDFTFNQTKKIDRNGKIDSKTIHYMLSSYDHGYENDENNPFSWKYKPDQKELKSLIKDGKIEEAKLKIKDDLDLYSDEYDASLGLPYEELLFTSKVNEFKTREIIDGTDFMKITFTATSTFDKLDGQTEDWESTWII